MTKPRTTPTPNHILDNMANMKPSVFAICMAVVRQTAGYDAGKGDGTRREWDEISTSQFMKLTGLSNRAVIDGIKQAVEDGWIERKKDGNSFRYRVAPYEKSSQVIVNYENSSQVSYEESSQIDDENYENSSHTKESNNNTPNGVAGKPPALPSLAEQFHALHAELETAKNRGGVLQRIYTLCFGDHNPPDYGRLVKIGKQIGAGYFAQRMFELVARPPNGDILSYIQAEHRNKQHRANGNGKVAPTANSSWVDLQTDLPEYMEQPNGA